VRRLVEHKNVMAPKIGQWLYASCSAEDYGQIVAVGEDDNGVPTIDIRLSNPQDLVTCEDETEWADPLTTLEVPPGVALVLRHVQWRPGSGDGVDGATFIVCNTPGSECFRCTKLFQLCDEPVEAAGSVGLVGPVGA